MSSANATTARSVDVALASIKAMEDLDLDAIRANTHLDMVNREAFAEPPACREPGPDGVYATAEWLHNLAADIAWDVHQVIAQDDLVAAHVTMRGTQSNPHEIFAGGDEPVQLMPNHGRQFAVTQTHWFRLHDDRVIEHWANRDDLTMAMQLGWFGA